MAWRIKFSAAADRAFGKLDLPLRRRFINFLETRVLPEPRRLGKAMRGDSRAWRYRLGSYRIVCDIDDATSTIYVVRIGHRSSVYD